MTIEKVCLFSPGDIDALQFKCSHCGSSTSIPLNNLSSSGVSMAISGTCPQCGAEPGFNVGTSDQESVIRFAQILGRLTDILQGRNIQLAFKVKCRE